MGRALRDLEAIYDSIHADSSDAAFAWFNSLADSIYSLEDFPDRGAVTPESKAHRQILYGKKPHVYRIIYQVEQRNRAVNVVHIRHGAMDKFRLEDISQPD